MNRWKVRWSILLLLWGAVVMKSAAMKVESLDRGWFFNKEPDRFCGVSSFGACSISRRLDVGRELLLGEMIKGW